ncbi:MAG: DNA polymerase Y family protein, partial [Gemmatimonadetes bacterium]|nr:DNA polymerase Y family protein [Gemmatimonadota bacterium]
MSREQNAPTPPGAPALSDLRLTRRILAAWLPWWRTERLVRRCPEARNHPFVTVADSRGRQIIDAANPLATRAGLTPGMPLADARAVVPDVVVRPADPQGDVLALERLAHWADRFTPRVMPDGMDTIFLDIAGCTRLFGGEEALMGSLRAALEDFGLTARLALADTPGAAWALAHCGAEDPAVVPAGAGPDGLKDALAELPVAALRLSADVADGLASFGLNRICRLFVMESVELVRRFGVEPVRRLEQALGRVEEPIIPLCPSPPRKASRAFAEPISTAADIRAALDGLLDDLCLALSRSGEGTRRLHLLCHRVDGDRQTLTIGTSRPLRRKKPLMGLFTEKLDQVEPGFGIDEIVLVADVVETIDELQTDW